MFDNLFQREVDYAWNKEDTELMDLAKKKQLFVLEAENKNIAWQTSYNLSLQYAQFFIAPMIYSQKIRFKPHIIEWFEKYGKEKSVSQYFCWPPQEVSLTSLLEHLNPPTFFLFCYLASVNKRIYKYEKTPIYVNQYYSQIPLKKMYENLEKAELIEKVKEDAWRHSKTDQAILIRDKVLKILSIAEFAAESERATHIIYQLIINAKALGKQLAIEEAPDRAKKCDCPICSRLPKTEVSFEPDRLPLIPFHYACYSFAPELEKSKEEKQILEELYGKRRPKN